MLLRTHLRSRLKPPVHLVDPVLRLHHVWRVPPVEGSERRGVERVVGRVGHVRAVGAVPRLLAGQCERHIHAAHMEDGSSRKQCQSEALSRTKPRVVLPARCTRRATEQLRVNMGGGRGERGRGGGDCERQGKERERERRRAGGSEGGGGVNSG